MTIIKPKKKKRKERKLLDHTTIIVKFFIRKNIIMKFTSLGTTYFQKLIYIYIYKTEAFEAPTIFHVSTILKINK